MPKRRGGEEAEEGEEPVTGKEKTGKKGKEKMGTSVKKRRGRDEGKVGETMGK